MSNEELTRNEKLATKCYLKAMEEDDPVRMKEWVESAVLLEREQTSHDNMNVNWNKTLMEDKRETNKTLFTIGVTALSTVGSMLSMKWLIDTGIKFEEKGLIPATLPIKTAIKALESSVLKIFKH